MTPERAREILPIIQAHAEGKPVYFVMHNTLGEIVYHKCGRNIRFDHGTYVLEIPGKPGKTKREIILQNAADSLESMIEPANNYAQSVIDDCVCEALSVVLTEDINTAKKSLAELKKEFNIE